MSPWSSQFARCCFDADVVVGGDVDDCDVVASGGGDVDGIGSLSVLDDDVMDVVAGSLVINTCSCFWALARNSSTVASDFLRTAASL